MLGAKSAPFRCVPQWYPAPFFFFFFSASSLVSLTFTRFPSLHHRVVFPVEENEPGWATSRNPDTSGILIGILQKSSYRRRVETRAVLRDRRASYDVQCIECGEWKDPSAFQQIFRKGCMRSLTCEECQLRMARSGSRLKQLRLTAKRFYNRKDNSMSYDDIFRRIQQDCWYCERPSTARRVNGLDRVDSRVGHTGDNCIVACGPCNVAKNRLDPWSFVQRCEAIATGVGATGAYASAWPPLRQWDEPEEASALDARTSSVIKNGPEVAEDAEANKGLEASDGDALAVVADDQAIKAATRADEQAAVVADALLTLMSNASETNSGAARTSLGRHSYRSWMAECSKNHKRPTITEEQYGELLASPCNYCRRTGRVTLVLDLRKGRVNLANVRPLCVECSNMRTQQSHCKFFSMCQRIARVGHMREEFLPYTQNVRALSQVGRVRDAHVRVVQEEVGIRLGEVLYDPNDSSGDESQSFYPETCFADSGDETGGTEEDPEAEAVEEGEDDSLDDDLEMDPQNLDVRSASGSALVESFSSGANKAPEEPKVPVADETEEPAASAVPVPEEPAALPVCSPEKVTEPFACASEELEMPVVCTPEEHATPDVCTLEQPNTFDDQASGDSDDDVWEDSVETLAREDAKNAAETTPPSTLATPNNVLDQPTTSPPTSNATFRAPALQQPSSSKSSDSMTYKVMGATASLIWHGTPWVIKGIGRVSATARNVAAGATQRRLVFATETSDDAKPSAVSSCETAAARSAELDRLQAAPRDQRNAAKVAEERSDSIGMSASASNTPQDLDELDAWTACRQEASAGSEVAWNNGEIVALGASQLEQSQSPSFSREEESAIVTPQRPRKPVASRSQSSTPIPAVASQPKMLVGASPRPSEGVGDVLTPQPPARRPSASQDMYGPDSPCGTFNAKSVGRTLCAGTPQLDEDGEFVYSSGGWLQTVPCDVVCTKGARCTRCEKAFIKGASKLACRGYYVEQRTLADDGIVERKRYDHACTFGGIAVNTRGRFAGRCAQCITTLKSSGDAESL